MLNKQFVSEFEDKGIHFPHICFEVISINICFLFYRRPTGTVALPEHVGHCVVISYHFIMFLLDAAKLATKSQR